MTARETIQDCHRLSASDWRAARRVRPSQLRGITLPERSGGRRTVGRRGESERGRGGGAEGAPVSPSLCQQREAIRNSFAPTAHSCVIRAHKFLSKKSATRVLFPSFSLPPYFPARGNKCKYEVNVIRTVKTRMLRFLRSFLLFLRGPRGRSKRSGKVQKVRLNVRAAASNRGRYLCGKLVCLSL